MKNNNVWAKFTQASQYLYKQTEGLIGLDKGQGGASRAGAIQFADAAFDLLIQDGVLSKPDFESIKDPSRLTNNLIYSFASALGDPAKTAYVNNNRDAYMTAISAALNVKIQTRLVKLEIANPEQNIEAKFVGCLHGASAEKVKLFKEQLLKKPEIQNYNLTVDDILIFTDQAAFERHKKEAFNASADTVIDTTAKDFLDI